MNAVQTAGSVDQVRTASLLGNTLKYVLVLPNTMLAALQSRSSAPATKGRNGFPVAAAADFRIDQAVNLVSRSVVMHL